MKVPHSKNTVFEKQYLPHSYIIDSYRILFVEDSKYRTSWLRCLTVWNPGQSREQNMDTMTLQDKRPETWMRLVMSVAKNWDLS